MLSGRTVHSCLHVHVIICKQPRHSTSNSRPPCFQIVNQFLLYQTDMRNSTELPGYDKVLDLMVQVGTVKHFGIPTALLLYTHVLATQHKARYTLNTGD